MPIEKFEDLVGTWVPSQRASEARDNQEVFHFSPLGHFVMEWTHEQQRRLQICEMTLTEEGFTFTSQSDGHALELEAEMEESQLVLTPPHGQKTILRRVVEEMEALDAEFFVKSDEE